MAKLTYQCGIFLTVAAFVLLLCGCISTTSPVVYTDNPKKDFEILGEVTYHSKMALPGIQKNGFTALLAAARTKYPDCDYVIDIMIDRKTTFVLFIFPYTNYVMRGTAIKYILRNSDGEIISKPIPSISASQESSDILNTVATASMSPGNTSEQLQSSSPPRQVEFQVGSNSGWPSDSIFRNSGLPRLRQPAGTVATYNSVNSFLTIFLKNGNQGTVDELISAIESVNQNNKFMHLNGIYTSNLLMPSALRDYSNNRSWIVKIELRYGGVILSTQFS